MKEAVLVLSTLCAMGCGVWLVKKMDAFMSAGNLRPYWDQQEEGEAQTMDRRNPPAP